MADNKSYLKPKVSVGKLSKVERKHGMFVNVSSYPQLGGFTGPDKLKGADPSMSLEKSPMARKGKPI
jgi:hypothetical protein